MKNQEELNSENEQLRTRLAFYESQLKEAIMRREEAGQPIQLFKILELFLKEKITILVTTFGVTLLFLLYALKLPNEYTATAILAPSVQNNAGGIAGLGTKLGGIANLAGLNLGGGAENKTLYAMKIIKTWDFLEKFVRKHELEVPLIASKGWSMSKNMLLLDENIYNDEEKKWLIKSRNTDQTESTPSGWQLFRMLNKRLEIQHKKDSGLFILSLTFYSPKLAKEWLDQLIFDINLHMKEQDRQKARRSIEYLEDRISKTRISEMQAVFYQLIEEQTKTLMLTEISDEYVFKTISPAKVPEIKSKPKRAVILIVGFVIGIISSIVIVLLKHSIGKTRKL